MPTFLFNEIIFGPVTSRRFGVSLGINLLPVEAKLCNFNCVYCECGFSYPLTANKRHLPSEEEIIEKLIAVLEKYVKEEKKIDSITFAGNGEPTLHPKFAKIIDKTIEARNKFMPQCQVCVLTNATRITHKNIKNALLKTDVCMFKLDAGTEDMYKIINQNIEPKTLTEIKNDLKKFERKVVIQSMFLKSSPPLKIDNTTPEEITAWLKIIREIEPQKVVLYSIDRDVPTEGLLKVDHELLENIAKQVRQLGIPAEVY